MSEQVIECVSCKETFDSSMRQYAHIRDVHVDANHCMRNTLSAFDVRHMVTSYIRSQESLGQKRSISSISEESVSLPTSMSFDIETTLLMTNDKISLSIPKETALLILEKNMEQLVETHKKTLDRINRLLVMRDQINHQ